MMDEGTLEMESLNLSESSNRTIFPNATENLAGVELFQYYFMPTLVYLGTVGNGLSVYVFFMTKLRKLSSSYYLATLAISDNIFLVSVFIVWLRMVDVNLFNRPVLCEMTIYVTGVCSFLSVWLVLAFTVERFIAVCYPLLRQSACTVSRAKIIIKVLVVLALALFSPMLFFADVRKDPDLNNREVCTVDPSWQHVAHIFNYVDTAVTFVIPVFVIVILNVCISRTIWKLAGVRKRLTHRGGQPVQNFQRKRTRIRYSPNAHNKVTKMLLVVSTVCLCLNFPSYIMRVLADLIELGLIKDVNRSMFLSVQHWCQTLYYINFGINFALYCISGQNFRKALRSLFCTRTLHRNETTPLTESRTQSSGSTATSKKRRTPQPVYLEDQELTPKDLCSTKSK